MAKLTELDREQFLDEVKENWSKWKNPTKAHELVKYMIDNAFTKKAKGTLEAMTKEQLKEIILNGDEESVTEAKKSSGAGLGSEIVSFLEEAKIEIHKKSFNPFVKKQIIKQIDKQAEKIEDESTFEKMGIFALVFFGILLLLEMVFENGFKDIIKKFKEYRERKTLEAEIVENDKNK